MRNLRGLIFAAAVIGPATTFVGCLLANSLDGVSDEPPESPPPDVLLYFPPESGPLFPVDDGAVRCGKLTGDPCCTGGLCGPGLACTADKCAPPVVEPCGDDGQKCCPPANSCKSGFDCADGKTCSKSPDPPPPCGHTTEVCCSGATACVDGNTICDGAHCVSCGAGGQPCCGGGGCVGGTICNGATCIGCGGDGQPCCPGGGCGSGLVCNGSACVGCGGGGQPCCPGGACGGGLVCGGASCIACGGVLQPCCAGGACGGSLTCIGSTCKECCAKCSNRTDYHNVGVTSDCTTAAKDYCATPASPTRGSFQDALWGSCP